MVADWLKLDRVRWVVLLSVLAGLIVGALSVVVVGNRPVTYQSRALVLVDQPGTLAAGADGGVIDKLSRLRAKYAGLVITDRIAVPVARDLGIPVADVRGHLVAVPIENTTLVAILASDPDRERARPLAQAAAQQLVDDTVAEQVRFTVPEDARIVVSIVTRAQQPERLGASVGRLVGLGIVSGGLAAVLVGIVLAARRPGPS